MQRPAVHLNNHGCPICSKKNKRKLYLLSKESFIEKSKQIYGDKFDYSKVEYDGMHKKVCLVCKEHGEFYQQAQTHLKGNVSCPKCIRANQIERQSSTLEYFINKANKIYDHLYDYSQTIYINDHTKVKIICKEHGEFWITPNSHLYSFRGCPFCTQPKGEQIISEKLKTMKIFFENQKTFDKCRNPKTNKLLKFDFYLPKHNICIEYDGWYHYKPHRKQTSQDLVLTKERDEIKNKFCLNNNIKLIRIPYWEIKNISNVLNDL